MTAQHYRVWCRFEPDYLNPLTGRRGQWRVIDCWKRNDGYDADDLFCQLRLMCDRAMALSSTKPYPVGSIIKPHKELNRVQAAMRSEVAA